MTTVSSQAVSKKHIGQVEGYFDKRADYWSDAYQKPHHVNDYVLLDRKNIAVSFLCERVKPGTEILDAGCGAGLATLDLIKGGYTVHAIDVAQKMVDLCLENLKRTKLDAGQSLIERGDVLKKNIPDEKYDGIIALGFLQYQADEHEALIELKRLLKPGGALVMSGPARIKLSEYFGLGKLYYWLRDLRKPPNPELTALLEISRHNYTVGRFKELLKNAGFRMQDYRGHGFVNFAILRDFTSRGQFFLYRFFGKLSRFLPIQRFANDIVVVAVKPTGK